MCAALWPSASWCSMPWCRRTGWGSACSAPTAVWTSWNEAFLDIYAIPSGQPLAGNRLRELIEILRISGNLLGGLRTACRDQSRQRQRRTIGNHRRAAATVGTSELNSGRYRPAAGSPRHSDVTDYMMAEQRFAYVTLHDLATGLPNRAAFNQRIVAESRSGARSAGELRGDPTRDRQLQGDQRRLRSIGRRRGARTRWPRGFPRPAIGAFSRARVATSFRSSRTPDQAEGAVQDICSQVAALCDIEFEIEGHTIRVGSTAGVSIYPRDGDNAETLIAHADVALYRAKTERRGTVCVFEPAMDLQIREKRALQRELALGAAERRVRAPLPAAGDHRRARSSASRLCCAGAIRFAAWCRRRSSFRWPRRPG